MRRLTDEELVLLHDECGDGCECEIDEDSDDQDWFSDREEFVFDALLGRGLVYKATCQIKSDEYHAARTSLGELALRLEFLLRELERGADAR